MSNTLSNEELLVRFKEDIKLYLLDGLQKKTISFKHASELSNYILTDIKPSLPREKFLLLLHDLGRLFPEITTILQKYETTQTPQESIAQITQQLAEQSPS
jgi:hypothetical protein